MRELAEDRQVRGKRSTRSEGRQRDDQRLQKITEMAACIVDLQTIRKYQLSLCDTH